MINWIAVKEASLEEMKQKWDSLPKELRYAAYGGLGGSTLAMLIHRLMGTDHRKGRTIGWGAIGALTGGAGGAVTGYTERKITPFVKTFVNNLNDTVKSFDDNMQQAVKTQQKAEEAVDKLTTTVDNTAKDLNNNISNVTTPAGAILNEFALMLRGARKAGEKTGRWISKWGKR